MNFNCQDQEHIKHHLKRVFLALGHLTDLRRRRWDSMSDVTMLNALGMANDYLELISDLMSVNTNEKSVTTLLSGSDLK